jgi:hypothetical protein
MEHYRNEKSLHKKYTLQLIDKCKKLMDSYDSLVYYKVEN